MLDPWALSASRVKKRLAWLAYEERALRRAGCLHALCEAELDAIRRLGLRNPVCIVPNGVDPPTAPNDAAPDWAAALRPGERALLFLGRIHPKKNLPSLVEAFARLRPPGWRLVVAGWDQGGHCSELEALASDLGARDRILFAGPQFGAQKHATLQVADAFVLPSLSEGLPMAVLEAWASGLPVLMTRHCNLPEGFAMGAAIEMASSADGIEAVLRALVEMPDEARRAMGRNGERLVRLRFTWPAAASRLAAVYRWLAGLETMPDCVDR